MIQRLVKLHFHPQHCAAYEAIYQSSRQRIRATPGCLHLESWRDLQQPNIYYTYSRWQDEASLNAYRHSDFFQATWAKTKALFSNKPEALSAEALPHIAPPPEGLQRLEVEDYHVDIGPLSATHFGWLAQRNYTHCFVITDENTRRDCWPLLQPWLAEQTSVQHISVPAGELHKHLGTCQSIWQQMFEAGLGRKACVLNLGGGVIGDMGGFAAATYKRGIDFIQIPTTLLSQVDASVGGKLGIDFYELKNSIGVFTNPQAVWIDPRFLQTLPTREIRSGYAEIIKHALIADQAQWEELQQLKDLQEADWPSIIPASVAIKREIVLADPQEQGLRKALNFGHTIGHAIESYWLPTKQRLLHGEAIAAGMIAEAWISTQLAGLSEAELAQIAQYLLTIYGHQAIPEDAFEQLLAWMQQDKKNDDSRINFTLLERCGKARVNATASEELIREAMRYYNGLAT